MGLIKIWFALTGLILITAMIWAFVPVLVPILGLTVGMGLLVAGIVASARAYERHRDGRHPKA